MSDRLISQAAALVHVELGADWWQAYGKIQDLPTTPDIASIFQAIPADFCSLIIDMITTEIHREMPDYDPQDFPEELFDAHPLAPLREALIEANGGSY